MKSYNNNNTKGIKGWALEDRPREKMFTKSNKALSDAELLAIIIGSGTGNQSAVALAREILSSVSNNLAELGRLSISDLLKFKGIGTAKASNIVAVMELGRRRKLTENLRKQKINTSRDAFNLIQPVIGELPHEEFWVIALRTGNHFHRSICISEGGLAATIADPKKIFRLAIENNAASIILCHNHPGGNARPSKRDIDITNKCVEAGKFIDLPVIDHLIIANDNYYSFGDEGMI